MIKFNGTLIHLYLQSELGIFIQSLSATIESSILGTLLDNFFSKNVKMPNFLMLYANSFT